MDGPSSQASLELSSTELGALSEAGRRALVMALVAAVRADGRVDPREVMQLNALLPRWAWSEAGVSEATVAGYFEQAEERIGALHSRRDVVQLGEDCGAALVSPSLREKVIRLMVALAYADGAFLPEEKGFLFAFNEGFGLPIERLAQCCNRDDDRDIFAATARGHLEQVQSLLDRGTPVGIRDPQQWTPLHVAVAKGYLPIVDLLIARGADVHARHGQNSPPLFLACNKPYEAIVERLLRAGARVNDTGSNNMTALHLAALFGQPGVARVLHRAGARLDLLDADGRTPLHSAASEGHAEVVTVLLAAGAAVDTRSRKGCTALMFAATRGDVRTMTVLLDAGADPDARDVDGQSSLIYAASNQPAAVSLLLARGARPDLASAQGVTPLHVAARGGFSTCVRLLLDGGAPIEAANVEGGTPLFGAAVHGRSDVYDLLVLRGANPHARTRHGGTPAESFGASKAVALRSVPFVAPPPDSPDPPASLPNPGSLVNALERALSVIPLTDEAASLAARFDDYQVAAWASDQPGPAQVLVAGKDHHGRPIYVAASSLKKHGEARTRLLILAGARGRHWLPVFTTHAAAQAFRQRTDLLWPEDGKGMADAVVGTTRAVGVFRIAALPVDGVLVNPYGPGGPRVLSLEECDRIARLLPH